MGYKDLIKNIDSKNRSVRTLVLMLNGFMFTHSQNTSKFLIYIEIETKQKVKNARQKKIRNKFI